MYLCRGEAHQSVPQDCKADCSHPEQGDGARNRILPSGSRKEVHQYSDYCSADGADYDDVCLDFLPIERGCSSPAVGDEGDEEGLKSC